MMKKVLQFGARARVAHHAVGLRTDVLRCFQGAVLDGHLQGTIGHRIPKHQRQSSGNLMSVRFGRVKIRIQKARRFQGEDHRAFQRIRRLSVFGEKGIHKHLALCLGQRPTKCCAHKTSRKGPDLVAALRIALARAGQSIHVVHHTCRRFQGAVGGGLIPRLGNRDAARKPMTAVIRWQRRLHGKHTRRLFGHELAARDDLLHAMRRLPAQLNRSGLVFPLEKIQRNRHGATAKQSQ